MEEKLLKPIPEVSYLTAANASRYRAILRYFYLQHERLRHYLFPEEVFEYLKQSGYFAEYTREQLQYDLDQLVEWKNLIPRQDTARVTSIEEFKKKRFRYQCTPYTVEIERMVQKLEQLGDSFGGSLERTLFDRLLDLLLRLTSERKDIENLSNEELHNLWEDMYDNFRKLTENATDYLAHLQSEKIEEIMQTEEFLAYKDAITDYLRNFMTALQRTSFRIEAALEKTSPEHLQDIAARLAEYYLSIPRLDERPTKDQLIQQYLSQWQDIANWFLGRSGQESDLVYLQNATNETIRRITRYAQRLGEKHHNFKSRRKDYLHLAKWFGDLDDIQEAHRLSACVFGVFHTRHLYAEAKQTEDIYAEIWDEKPTEVTVNPRVRNYREKTKPRAVISHREEKEAALQQYLQEKEIERQLIAEMLEKDRIVISDLPVVDTRARKILLNWIEKCMGNTDRTAKTETGRPIKMEVFDSRQVTLSCEDGILMMPNYVFYFIAV